MYRRTTIRNMASIFIVLFIVALFIMTIVSAAQALDAIKAYYNSYYSYYVEFYKSMQSILVVSIIFSSIGIICAVAGIYSFANDGKFKAFAFPTFLLIYGLSSMIVNLIAESALKKLSAALYIQYETPASTIAIIVLFIVAILESIIAVFYQLSYRYKKMTNIAITVGYLIWFVIVIIDTVNISSPSATQVTELVFQYIVTIAVMFLFIISYAQDQEYAFNKPYYNVVTPQIAKQINSQNTPVESEKKDASVEERLSNLKSLYDKNLITEEEYKKKREEILKTL